MISIRTQTIHDLKQSVVEIITKHKKEIDVAQQLRETNEKLVDQLLRTVQKLFSGHAHMAMLDALTLRDPPQPKEQKELFFSSFLNIMIIKRCRIILRELDRVTAVKNHIVASEMLHKSPQLFPKEVLKKNLESEMKKEIFEEIQHEESNQPMLKGQVTYTLDHDDETDSLDTLDSDVSLSLHQDHVNDGTPDDRIDNHSIATQDKLLCKACGTSPCTWYDSIDSNTLTTRRNDISAKLVGLKQKRVTILTRNLETGDIDDEIKTLTNELIHIEEKIKLSAVDKELHDSINSSSKYFLVRSLHGYDTLMHTDEAECALMVEHDRLTAILASKEVLNDILERFVSRYQLELVS